MPVRRDVCQAHKVRVCCRRLVDTGRKNRVNRLELRRSSILVVRMEALVLIVRVVEGATPVPITGYRAQKSFSYVLCELGTLAVLR